MANERVSIASGEALFSSDTEITFKAEAFKVIENGDGSVTLEATQRPPEVLRGGCGITFVFNVPFCDKGESCTADTCLGPFRDLQTGILYCECDD
jgi:hypothetical protein